MVNVKRLKRQKVEKSYRHCGSQIFNFQFSILNLHLSSIFRRKKRHISLYLLISP